MTLFKIRSKERKQKEQQEVTGADDDDVDISTRSVLQHASGAPKGFASSNKKGNKGNKRRETMNMTSASESGPQQPTIDMLPLLVSEIGNPKKCAGALRSLFALSEHASSKSNREKMVGGRLVPALLDFLKQCPKSSSEQYLALLVLNNVSIPAENKRKIAIECGGARLLSRMLCEDPSCHLLAIILVNLTFADGDLRRELIKSDPSIQLVEALSFALLVASSTQEEHDARTPIKLENDDVEGAAPGDLLRAAMAADALVNGGAKFFDPDRQIYPETARWCLSALKNLTRPSPSRDYNVVLAVIQSGIVPLILRLVTVGQRDGVGRSGSDMTPVPVDPLSSTPPCTSKNNSSLSAPEKSAMASDSFSHKNQPSSWDANSIQDAALFTVFNLASSAPARGYLRACEALTTLSQIADYATIHSSSDQEMSSSGQLQQQFQCLKARMALAYLVGSEGHFGQPRDDSLGGFSGANDESVLLVTHAEAENTIDLLADVLHMRSRDGPGGYSAATFSVKSVLQAVRCLLTNHINQITFASSGVRLNCLLLKAVALFCSNRVPTVDVEAVEHACFSLYLQSNYGFKDPFLLDCYDAELLEKIVSSFLDIDNISPPSRHAAIQIWLRTQYLKYEGSLEELADSLTSTNSTISNKRAQPQDFDLDEHLRAAFEGVVIERRPKGTKPVDSIFGRPILRSRVPETGNNAPWDSRKSFISVFPSALHAVQPLSFGSTKVRHLDAIDDILIANNIACSANGEKTESYQYWWTWKDTAPLLQQKLQRTHSASSSSIRVSLYLKEKFRNDARVFIEKVASSQTGGDEDQPVSIFGFRCGRNSCLS